MSGCSQDNGIEETDLSCNSTLHSYLFKTQRSPCALQSLPVPFACRGYWSTCFAGMLRCVWGDSSKTGGLLSHADGACNLCSLSLFISICAPLLILQESYM